MNYTPIGNCGNSWALKGKGDMLAWAWWTWKAYDWSEGTVRTGFRVLGWTFYGFRRKL